jgi:hypothetical protein
MADTVTSQNVNLSSWDTLYSVQWQDYQWIIIIIIIIIIITINNLYLKWAFTRWQWYYNKTKHINNTHHTK